MKADNRSLLTDFSRQTSGISVSCPCQLSHCRCTVIQLLTTILTILNYRLSPLYPHFNRRKNKPQLVVTAELRQLLIYMEAFNVDCSER